MKRLKILDKKLFRFLLKMLIHLMDVQLLYYRLKFYGGLSLDLERHREWKFIAEKVRPGARPEGRKRKYELTNCYFSWLCSNMPSMSIFSLCYRWVTGATILLNLLRHVSRIIIHHVHFIAPAKKFFLSCMSFTMFLENQSLGLHHFLFYTFWPYDY